MNLGFSEVLAMLPIELLAMIGAGAVLPYVAEGAYDWLKQLRRHPDGANAPE